MIKIKKQKQNNEGKDVKSEQKKSIGENEETKDNG